jgi:hypothetical protein
MSRLAQAYRKSGGGPFSGQLDYATSSADSWITTKVPWGFDDSVFIENRPMIRPATGGAAIAVDPLCRRAVEPAAVAQREELLPLVQRIIQAGVSERPLRSLLFAAIDHERSADVCAGAAEALARQIVGSVCLVDANLRSPSVTTSFGAVDAAGISDLLRAERDLRTCLTRLTSNLWVLPAGNRSADAAPLLVGEQGRRVLMELKATFDYVLLDTAPLGGHRDAVSIGTAADGVVLVVAANKTRREAAKSAAQHLVKGNAHILGAVLTDRTFPIPEAVYRKL